MRAVVALAAAAAAAGCSAELERDDRLAFVSPPDGARLRAPVLLRWSAPSVAAKGFDGSRDPRVFGVFVDAPPLRPGQHIDTLGARERTCVATPGCPDRTWLADHGIHLTTRPQLLLDGLPAKGGRKAPGGRRHEVTVVLLDGRGVRVGEGAWRREFTAPEAGGR